MAIRIRIGTLVRRALVEVCTAPVLLVYNAFIASEVSWTIIGITSAS